MNVVDIGTITAKLVLEDGHIKKQMYKNIAQLEKDIMKAGRVWDTNFVDKIGDANRAVESLRHRTRRAVKDISRIITGILISRVFYGLVRSIQSGIKAVFSFAASMERAQVAFTRLLGNHAAAMQLLGDLEDLAAVTPVQIEPIKDAAQHFLAMGFAAKDVTPTIRTLIDAVSAAGGTSHQFETVVRSLGRIKGMGVLSAREIRSLASAQIPVYDILRKQLKLTNEQMRNIGKMRIPAERAIKAITDGMNKRFSGMAKEMSRTWTGLISTIKDNAMLIGRDITAGMFSGIKRQLQSLLKVLQKIRDAGRTGGLGGLFEEMIPPSLQGALRQVLYSFRVLRKTITYLWKATKPLRDAMVSFGINVLALVLPPLTKLITIMAVLVDKIIRNKYLVVLLAAALTELMVATTVNLALHALTVTIRALGIASAVTKSITGLTSALKLLGGVLIGHPIGALIAAAAAYVLYLAASSKIAVRWLDALISRIKTLFGFDTSSYLQPMDMSSDKVELDNISTGFAEVGEEAANAANKVKEFLAPFDEIIKLPDLSGAAGLADFGDEFGIGGFADMTQPDPLTMPEIEFPTLKELFKSMLNKIWEFAKKLPKIIWTGLNKAWENIKKIPGWFKTAFDNAWPHISNFFSKLPGHVMTGLGFLWKWTKKIGGWFKDGFDMAMPYVLAFWLNWPSYVLTGLNFLWDWTKKIGGWFKTGFDEAKPHVTSFFEGMPALISEGFGNAKKYVLDKLQELEDTLGLNYNGVKTHILNFGKKIGEWFQEAYEMKSGSKNKFVDDLPKIFADALRNVGKKIWKDIIDLDGIWSELFPMLEKSAKKNGSMWETTVMWVLENAWKTFLKFVDQKVLEWAIKGYEFVNIMEWIGEELAPVIEGFVFELPLLIHKAFVEDFQGVVNGLTDDWELFKNRIGLKIDLMMLNMANKFMLSDTKANLDQALLDMMVLWQTHDGDVMKIIKDLVDKEVAEFKLLPGKIEKALDGFDDKIDEIYHTIYDTGAEWIDKWPKTWEEAKTKMITVAETLLNELVKLFTKPFVVTLEWGLEGLGKLGEYLQGIMEEADQIVNGASPTGTYDPRTDRTVTPYENPVYDIKIIAPELENLTEAEELLREKLLSLRTRGYARGGIVTRNQLVEVAEGNNAEAILPLTSESAMAPYAKVVANYLAETLTGLKEAVEANASGGNTIQAGIIVADDRTLLKFKRMLDKVDGR